MYLSPLKFHLPLIFATRVAIEGGELLKSKDRRKLEADENLVPPKKCMCGELLDLIHTYYTTK